MRADSRALTALCSEPNIPAELATATAAQPAKEITHKLCCIVLQPVLTHWWGGTVGDAVVHL